MSGQHLRLDDLGDEELLHVAEVLGTLARTSAVHPCLLTALARTAAAARAEVDERLEVAFALTIPVSTTPRRRTP